MSRLLLAAALGTGITAALVVVAAAPASAATEFVAIGDSITAGTSWPAICSICPAIFDCSGGCDGMSSSNREKCGHTRRLDDWMDTWLGAGNHVVNKGIGGEGTNAAVTRLPMELNAVCGTPGNCIAVVLMHGTNDLNSNLMSAETARDHLRLMILEAKSRNIDTLLMTIIRKGDNLMHATWEFYKDIVLALAAEQNLQSVNPWLPLCDDQSCVDANYWIAGEPPCNDPDATPDPGHLDPDGYDVLTGLIQDVFPPAAPAAPAPTAPAGVIADPQPDFVWDEAADARWYQLEVDGGSTWWEAAAHCGGSCTVDPGVPLAEGAHSWRVRGRNLRGMGAWSASTAFEISSVPDAPTPTAPTGDHFAPFAPLYAWLPEEDATEYDLEVRDAGGNLDASAAGLLASAVCDGGLCSYQGGALADPDDYTLKVLGRNAAGSGPLSSPGVDFTVLACADPSTQDLQTLEPSPVTAAKTVTHCGPVTAGDPSPYTIEATGDLTVHTRDGLTAHDGFTVKGVLRVLSP